MGTNQVANTSTTTRQFFPTIAATSVPRRRTENSGLYVFSHTIERPSLGVIKTQPRTALQITVF